MPQLYIPKFHRQRFLLYVLEKSNGILLKADFFKQLFLLHQKAEFAYYDFIPYHSNYYSFQAENDINILEKQGWLKESGDNIVLLKSIINQSNNVKDILKIDYLSKQKSVLVKTSNFPQSQSNNKTNTLFTIGYEGISFDAYVNHLLKNKINLICDVRKNAFSRKFGFSKNIMLELLQKIDIQYEHIPELGIESSARKDLKTKEEYLKLFDKYQVSLPQKKTSLKYLIHLLEKYQHIAITCFEKKHQECHRHCISDYLQTKNNVKVIHL